MKNLCVVLCNIISRPFERIQNNRMLRMGHFRPYQNSYFQINTTPVKLITLWGYVLYILRMLLKVFGGTSQKAIGVLYSHTMNAFVSLFCSLETKKLPNLFAQIASCDCFQKSNEAPKDKDVPPLWIFKRCVGVLGDAKRKVPELFSANGSH